MQNLGKRKREECEKTKTRAKAHHGGTESRRKAKEKKGIHCREAGKVPIREKAIEYFYAAVTEKTESTEQAGCSMLNAECCMPNAKCQLLIANC
jgi:hypothetical protein